MCREKRHISSIFNGYRQDDIEAIAIVGKGNTLITPCGACRQVLVELLKRDTPIVLGTKDEVVVTNIEELMPMSFTSDSL